MPNHTLAFYSGVATGTASGIGADANTPELARDTAQYSAGVALDQLSALTQFVANLLLSMV